MPSRFLQAIGVDLRSDEEREARGRAVRTSRHSSRVTSSRHRSTKLRTKERNKSSRPLMSATTGSESERWSRKKSSIRSNSGKKRSPKRREEAEVERAARRRERKDGKSRVKEDFVVGEIGATEAEAEPVPSVADEEPTLRDIPQQQAVNVFAFQSDWSDDEATGKEPSHQPVKNVEHAAQYGDHPAEYEDATDGQETDHHHPEEHTDNEHQQQGLRSGAEHHTREEHDNSSTTVTEAPSSQPQPELSSQPHRSLAASVVDETDDVPTPMPQDFKFSPIRTVSSGSSFVSTHTQYTEPRDDAETERSTSPETSFKSPSPMHATPHNQETLTQPEREVAEQPQTSSAAKLAAQTLAAEHRQKTIRRRSSHHSRRPEMPRHYPSHQPYQNPWIAGYPNAQTLSPIPPYNPGDQALSPHIPGYPPAPSPAHALSPHVPVDATGNPPPLTGYAALATALSPHSSSSPDPASAVFQPSSTLPPLYRRFTSLNHRLLLHLQDELAELEEELAYLDSLDTAARTHPSSHPGRLVIRPASRREAALGGSEVDWRKGDVMGRISSILHLYNETLASFQKTAALARAKEEEVEAYHEYLATKRPLIEAESSFINHSEDLVSLAPKRLHNHAHAEEENVMRSNARPQRRLTATAHSETSHHLSSQSQTTRQKHQQALFLAALLSVLVPIMVFHVVPNFIGRMVVAILIAVGIMGLLVQTGATELLALGRKEKRIIAGTWSGGMTLLALVA